MGSSRWFRGETPVAVGVRPAQHLDRARDAVCEEIAIVATACSRRGHHAPGDGQAARSQVRAGVVRAAARAAAVWGSDALPCRWVSVLEVMGRAICVDQAVERIASDTGAAVMVEIGGFIATSGAAPPGGWRVGGAGNALWGGALASSGPVVQAWDGAAHRLLVDHRQRPTCERAPWSGWREVTVSAAQCVEAATWVLAAYAWGPGARARMTRSGLPSTLVAEDRSVTVLGPWPGSGVVGTPPAGHAKAPGRAGDRIPGADVRRAG